MENKLEAQRLAAEKKATEERIAKELADKKIAEELAFKKKEEEKAAQEAAEKLAVEAKKKAEITAAQKKAEDDYNNAIAVAKRAKESQERKENEKLAAKLEANDEKEYEDVMKNISMA